MPSVYIPEEHELLRYVPWAKLRKDEDDHVLGVLSAAFRLREGEDYLSSTWVEFFQQPSRLDNLTSAVRAIRGSDLKVTAKSGFAIGRVAKVKEACARRAKTLRVIHEEEPDNAAHVAVRNWPKDDDDLLELMANEIWAEHILNSSIP